MFNIMNDNAFMQLRDNIVRNNDIHRYNTRNANLFNTDNLCHNTFIYIGVKYWNTISLVLDTNVSYVCFKNMAQSICINLSLYFYT